MKKWVTLIFALLLFFICHVNAHADEDNQLAVDMNITEKVTLNYIDDQTGEEISLAVEPIKEQTSGKRVRRSLGAGTYKVSKSSKGYWSVSYNIKINGSKQIVGTSNLSVVVHQGSLVSSSLTYTAKKATCSFARKVGFIKSNASVIADISSGKLVVR